MALYAIGDVQGCNDELGALLQALNFSADRDRLWFVGDLVNRGPDSLGVLRRIRALGDAATVTLGNHDLHLLAVAFGIRPHSQRRYARANPGRARSRFPARVARRPAAFSRGPRAERVHAARRLGAAMGYGAGAAMRARSRARSASATLENCSSGSTAISRTAGTTPWKARDALRFIVNCFTRLRYVDADGRLALRVKGSPKKSQTPTLIPWFEARDARWRGPRVVFGHWSTLGFFDHAEVTGLDTGCVWGGA